MLSRSRPIAKEKMIKNSEVMSAILSTIIYQVGHGNENTLDELWWHIFGIDRGENSSVSLRVDSNGDISKSKESGRKLVVTRRELDEFIESRIYKVRDMVNSSNNVFAGSFIFLEENK